MINSSIPLCSRRYALLQQSSNRKHALEAETISAGNLIVPTAIVVQAQGANPAHSSTISR